MKNGKEQLQKTYPGTTVEGHFANTLRDVDAMVGFQWDAEFARSASINASVTATNGLTSMRLTSAFAATLKAAAATTTCGLHTHSASFRPTESNTRSVHAFKDVSLPQHIMHTWTSCNTSDVDSHYSAFNQDKTPPNRTCSHRMTPAASKGQVETRRRMTNCPQDGRNGSRSAAISTHTRLYDSHSVFTRTRPTNARNNMSTCTQSQDATASVSPVAVAWASRHWRDTMSLNFTNNASNATGVGALLAECTA
jgi:hypothetical protein